METKKFSYDFQGRSLKVEFGCLAQQANGSVLVSYGDTVVLATAVMSQKPKEHCDYLPLTVEYEEKLYAAGKIKGSRFIKREGRPQDEAISSCRLIDRVLRPRFNQNIRNDIQIVVTVLSFDKENDPDVLGVLAASLALSVSDIPWSGPVAGVRIGRLNEQFIVNPTCEQSEKGDLDLIVCGTEQKINMLEADAKEIPEEIMLQAVAKGFDGYKRLIDFQKQIIEELKPQKTELLLQEPAQDLRDKVEKFLENKLEEAIYAKEKSTRLTQLNALAENLVRFIKDSETANAKAEDIEIKIFHSLSMFNDAIDHLVHKNILEKGKRPDGRALNEIREISCRAGLLPRTHGSALFNRGATQALSTITLGAPSDKQIIDGLKDEYKKRFLHHYNFPLFSVGETGPFRGPGRRALGQGALAERSLQTVIPSEEQFPYTIRVVSEILSSNGSSSMASVCGSSLALMDAGVPIKAPVAGIAMGLMMAEKSDEYKVITDIQGPEDHHGDMDCKIAGTAQGICGMQMDVKIEGVGLEILKDALEQSRQARLKILDEMNKVLDKPRPSLSDFAPRIITHQISPEQIREVIGPGGKIINEIIAQTGAKIDIEDSGLIFITSDNAEAAQKALTWIKDITRKVQPGEIFQGKVTRIINFGAFVEILPGQEGLVHISELAPYRVNKVEDIVKIGDVVSVKVRNIDEQGRINLSLKDAANPR